MPEATKRVAERDVPGIAEGIRAYSMTITPRAMLSRAVSVIRGRTLIINLPGSPKAVKESLGFILHGLDHGLKILRGPERVVKGELPLIFRDVGQADYELLAPLAAELLVQATKRQMTFLRREPAVHYVDADSKNALQEIRTVLNQNE